MSVTVLSPDRQDTPQPSIAEVQRARPEEEGADPFTATGQGIGAAGQPASCEESFAIPSSSASTATTTSSTTPSSCSNPTSTKGSSRSPARNQHRRANSESCISPQAACTLSTTPSLAFYDLRGRKRRFQFPTSHEQQGTGRRKRHRHGGQPAQFSSTDTSRPTTGSINPLHHNGNGGRVKPSRGRGGGRRGIATHVHQPKAPNNTSSFLINDLQERETSEQKQKTSTASNHSSTTDNTSNSLPQHHRPRSYSSLAAVSPVDHAADQLEDSFEEEDDSEFAAEFDNASMERIENLSRTEVNKEMLSVERVNRRLYDCVDTLKSENHRLKRVLESHGITYPIPTPGGNLLNKSRSSSTEGGEIGAEEQDEEEARDNDRRILSD